MNRVKRTGLIIVAGGSGQRMGTECPKQFLKIDGKEIILHTLDVFAQMNLFEEILIVCHNDYIELCRKLVDDAIGCNAVKIVSGGKSRQESVFNGLKAMNNCDCVLIHDAVRCCVNSADVSRLHEYVLKSGSCALGVRVKDTVKIADSSGYILSTPNREFLWQIQTPQAFNYDEICSAHERASKEHKEATDDCALIEMYGGKVRIVEGSYENIKITTPFDMDVAGLYIKKRSVQ